jgi:hypothetical protein
MTVTVKSTTCSWTLKLETVLSSETSVNFHQDNTLHPPYTIMNNKPMKQLVNTVVLWTVNHCALAVSFKIQDNSNLLSGFPWPIN